MPREGELSTNEKEFILTALEQGIRTDGRTFQAYRSLNITFGKSYGAVDVSLGDTRIAVRVSCEVIVPFPDRKFEGVFNINCEFSPMTSPSIELGRPTQDEVLLSRLLEKTIRRSSALDTESLCIVAGSKCFALRTDVHILNHDGNLIDAACIGVITGLQHFRRPDVSVEGGKARIYDVRERQPIPLSMLHHPLCVTFSFFNNGQAMLADCTAAEEQVRDSQVIIGMNQHGEICQIAKYGGNAINPLSVMNCTKQALPIVQEITRYIKAHLEADSKSRDPASLMDELRADNIR